MTSSSRPLKSTAGIARLQRLKGTATAHGPEFEWKVAGTVALRAFRKGLRFQVFTNVKEASPCDDLVVRVLGPHEKVVRPVTFFLQLKHVRPSAKRQCVTTQEFINSEGDFAIKKYFEAYERMISLQQKSDLTEDEKFLADSFKEDVRFVLYTNKSVKVRSLSVKEQPLLLEELFNTSVTEDHQIFSFSSEHLEVWNLINDKRRTLVYQRNFLPKLRVFSKQSNVDNLDSILRNEAEHIYCGDSQFFFKHFTSFLKKWAQDPQQDFALCEELVQQHLHLSLVQELRHRAEKSAGSEDLVFNAQALDPLRNHLRTAQRSNDLRIHLYLRGAPAPGRRAAKLLQVLREDFQDAWLYVDGSILKSIPADALAAVVNACVEVLVIDVEGSQDEMRAHDLIQSFVGNTLVVIFRTEPDETAWQDEWRLKDLSPDSQNILLQRNINFQGKTMPLGNVYAIWPSLYEDITADLLLSLERNEKVQIGNHFPYPEEELLPRSLDHHSVVSAEALVVLGLQGIHLALSGFPRAILEKMARHVGIGSSHNSMTRNESIFADNDKWTVIQHEGEFSSFSERNCLHSLARNIWPKTIHHLEYVSGDSLKDLVMLWRDTLGQNVEAARFVMRPLVQTVTDTCQPECICLHNSTADLHSLTSALLVGEAGVGKTTLMECIASEIKEKNPAHWVVVVKILEHRDLLRKWQREELTIHHAVELLAKAAGVTGASRLFLAGALQCEDGVSVFVDGVDEVVPVFKEHAVRLLEVLRQETNARRVWATSRPEVETVLRRALRSSPLSLRPLTSEEQLQTLCSQWGTRNQWDAKAFAERVVEWLAEEAGGLLAIPLHLQMLTQVLDPGDWLSHQRIPLEKTFSLLELYDKFVEKKRQLLQEKHFKDVVLENLPFDDRFMERHENCSVYYLFSDEEYEDDLPLHDLEEFIRRNEDIAKGKEKSGILWKDKDGRVNFIHQTFAEYFAAKWMWRNCCCNFTSTDGARRLLRRLNSERDQERTKRMKLFLVEMLKKEWPVHAAVWKCDLKTRDNLLHRDELSTAWQMKDPLLRWTAAEYMKWTFGSKDLVAGFKELKDCRKPWLAYALTTAAKGGYERVVQEMLYLADLADGKATRGYYKKPTAEEILSTSNASNVVSHTKSASEKLHSVDSLSQETFSPILELNDSESTDSKLSKIFLSSKSDEHNQVPRRSEYKMTKTLTFRLADNDKNFSESTVINAETELDASYQADPQTSERPTSVTHPFKIASTKYTKKFHSKSSGLGWFDEFKPKTKTLRLREFFSSIFNRERSSSKLKSSADRSPISKQPSISSSALLLALRLAAQGDTNAYTAIVETLLNYGTTDISQGDTALHEAAIVGNMGTVELLLRETETVNAQNTEGYTPLTCALGWINAVHRHCVAQRLLQEENMVVNVQDISGFTLLSHALLIDCKECVYSLLEKGADIDGSNAKPPMLVAIGLKRMDIVRFLIDHGADVNAGDKYGFTPLHSAAEKGFVDAICLLLSNGALVNSALDMGWTPLHGAALLDHMEALRLLLANGADVNLTDNQGRTSLHAITMGAASTKILKELLAQGADASAVDDQGRTPLDMALYQMDGYSKAEVLFAHAAQLPTDQQYAIAKNVLDYAVQTKNATCFKQLLCRGVDVNVTGPNGESLLHRACRLGILWGVELLLTQRADVHLKDSRGRTPLALALQKKNFKCAKALLDVAFI